MRKRRWIRICRTALCGVALAGALCQTASAAFFGGEPGAAAESTFQKISRGETALRILQFAQGYLRPNWLPVAIGAVILVLLGTIVALALQLYQYRKAIEQDEECDPVTGIGNKTYFARRFQRWLPDRRQGLCCVAFIGFDIIRVNEYYGELEAEEQLRFAAKELTLSAAESELVARVSGGGFAVARVSGGEQEVCTWAERLLGRLNQYTDKYGKNYRPEFHMGIYPLQLSDRSCETVLYNARQGYQRAVRDHLPYAFSRMEALQQKSEALQLKKRALEAVQNQEFQMFLQFIVHGDGDTIAGAEALSRWDHPQKGLLYPGSYIGLMEEEQTISALDFYIFEEACKLLERWHQQGRRLSISCNFTRITIDHEQFVSKLKKIADQYSFPRASLVIEITEDTMESNKETAFANVSACKKMGFRIALDDAGSGYASFSDLKDYPIDIVKIDRSILNAAVSPRGIALLKGMISLIHSMQMEALCEGVETAGQADLLRQLGCDYIQGYYYYRALPIEEADRFLEERAIC